MNKQQKQLLELAQICANFDKIVHLSKRFEHFISEDCKVTIYNNDNHDTHEIGFSLIEGDNTRPIEIALYTNRISFPIEMSVKEVNNLISFLIPFINETFVISPEEIERKIESERIATIEKLEKELETLKASK